jgi:hypothetical protein
MQKRASERIPANLRLRYTCCNYEYSGAVMNLSGNGMFINSDISFPIKSSFDVFIQWKEGILKVPVQIIRIVKSRNVYDGIGVKLLNIPEKYMELLINISLCYRA